jgi:Protein of unknown function (DUF2442)
VTVAEKNLVERFEEAIGGCRSDEALGARKDLDMVQAASIREDGMSLVCIATVTALAGQRLRLGLTDGTTIEREVGPLLNGPVFREIREKSELFAQAQAKGGTVVWPNGTDLCPDVLMWGGAPPADATARVQHD